MTRLRRLIGRVLCWLGRHDWSERGFMVRGESFTVWKQCERCFLEGEDFEP
jgi:hypothetical protein